MGVRVFYFSFSWVDLVFGGCDCRVSLEFGGCGCDFGMYCRRCVLCWVVIVGCMVGKELGWGWEIEGRDSIGSIGGGLVGIGCCLGCYLGGSGWYMGYRVDFILGIGEDGRCRVGIEFCRWKGLVVGCFFGGFEVEMGGK